MIIPTIAVEPNILSRVLSDYVNLIIFKEIIDRHDVKSQVSLNIDLDKIPASATIRKTTRNDGTLWVVIPNSAGRIFLVRINHNVTTRGMSFTPT